MTTTTLRAELVEDPAVVGVDVVVVSPRDVAVVGFVLEGHLAVVGFVLAGRLAVVEGFVLAGHLAVVAFVLAGLAVVEVTAGLGASVVTLLQVATSQVSVDRYLRTH